MNKTSYGSSFTTTLASRDIGGFVPIATYQIGYERFLSPASDNWPPYHCGEFLVIAVPDRRPTINFSMQEFLVYAILAFIVIAVIWWVVKILKGFANGYRSVNKADLRADTEKQMDRM